MALVAVVILCAAILALTVAADESGEDCQSVPLDWISKRPRDGQTSGVRQPLWGVATWMRVPSAGYPLSGGKGSTR